MDKVHIPVLTKEVIDLLKLKENDSVIDATLDGGGHSELMAKEIGSGGKILGIERDMAIIKTLQLSGNIEIACGNFADISGIAETRGFYSVNAVLFDLGLSSWHLEHSGRGFSFQKPDEPLLMNFGEDFKANAAEILNSYGEARLAEIFKNYGEESKARILARRVVEARKGKRILSVWDLELALGAKDKKVLARIFQSLRIEVNDELESLRKGLYGAFPLLKPGGRLAVISFHSLEDRIVKNFFKEKEKNGEADLITKKPVVPGEAEILKNSRVRSAKLRVLEKIIL